MASKVTSEEADPVRFSDIVTEPRRRLAPLRGYEDLPLVSLQVATHPLIPIIKDIEHMVDNALENSVNMSNPLPVDQRASIMLYTMEWTPKKKSFYYLLNEMLRSPNRNDLMEPWLPFLKLFLTALAGLPPTGWQTVFRGVKLDLRDQYPTGSRTVWWGFSSCTSSINVLESEQFFGKSGTRTLFSIECDTGKDIRHLAIFPGEEEMLLLPGREFEVKGCLNMGNNLYMIQMREVQPKFPNLAVVPAYLPEPQKTRIKLTYSGQRLNNDDMQRVMHEALVEKECAELDLSSNWITDEGAITIANLFRDNNVSAVAGGSCVDDFLALSIVDNEGTESRPE